MRNKNSIKVYKSRTYGYLRRIITGRSSVSPALLSKVLLLMYHDNISGRKAQERATYYLRRKVALHLPFQETGFDYTALCRFRVRLLVNKKQKLVFERFLQLAKEAGSLKKATCKSSIPAIF
ncbi:transposase [Sporomusa carbonis]|uniref:transposase n=1 Tax=Sporomusa carbonis TaxID=3076075 RepID=UPI003C79D3EB